jgi:hypothetical protein
VRCAGQAKSLRYERRPSHCPPTAAEAAGRPVWRNQSRGAGDAESLLAGPQVRGTAVQAPGFSGCIMAGKTLDEAHRMAVEALGLHIEA